MTRQRPLRAVLRVALVLAALTVSPACSPDEKGTETEPRAEAATAAPGRFAGKVVETMDAGIYTYVALEGGGKRLWAAGPKTPVALGDEIEIALDMRMEGFESETLGRTFDEIYFVASLEGPGAAGGPGHGADPHAGLPQFKSGPEAAAIDPDSIEKPTGGIRIAELWDRRSELVGQEVVLRGRVVKVNSGILGRNWVHVQDGSGDAGKGTHDLTITTEGRASVGDLVTVRGTVAVDRDFGAGYSYELIVEQAAVDVES